MQDDPLKRVKNYLRISERVGTSGQPEQEQFALIRESGFETLISLLPEGRGPDEEARWVQDAGMEFIQIPVVWHQPTPENLQTFFAAMDSRRDRKVFVHCVVNARVSAFLFLYRVLREGMDPEEAEVDLHDVWVPDGVWKTFIENALESNAR